MILEFEAYDPYDELLPKQKWDVQSTFKCNVTPYVLGVWVKTKNPDTRYPDMNQVIPLYLTQEQLNQHQENQDDNTSS
jgi:hypothetical protein